MNSASTEKQKWVKIAQTFMDELAYVTNDRDHWMNKYLDAVATGNAARMRKYNTWAEKRKRLVLELYSHYPKYEDWNIKEIAQLVGTTTPKARQIIDLYYQD